MSWSTENCCAGAFRVVDPPPGTVWTCGICGRHWVFRVGNDSLLRPARVAWWAEKKGERRQREAKQLAATVELRASQRAALAPGGRGSAVSLATAAVQDVADHDWEAEARGLAYMILTISSDYRALNVGDDGELLAVRKRDLGGDSELLRSAVISAEGWVTGTLSAVFAQADALGVEQSEDGFDWMEASRTLAEYILEIADCYRALTLDRAGHLVGPSRRQTRKLSRELYGVVTRAADWVNGPLLIAARAARAEPMS